MVQDHDKSRPKSPKFLPPLTPSIWDFQYTFSWMYFCKVINSEPGKELVDFVKNVNVKMKIFQSVLFYY